MKAKVVVMREIRRQRFFSLLTVLQVKFIQLFSEGSISPFHYPIFLRGYADEFAGEPNSDTAAPHQTLGRCNRCSCRSDDRLNRGAIFTIQRKSL